MLLGARWLLHETKADETSGRDHVAIAGPHEDVANEMRRQQRAQHEGDTASRCPGHPGQVDRIVDVTAHEDLQRRLSQIYHQPS